MHKTRHPSQEERTKDKMGIKDCKRMKLPGIYEERSRNGPKVWGEETHGERRKRGRVTGNIGRWGKREMNCE